ncbi:MAG TPA: signal peptidase II [Gammaproteobacteria bacterium]|nr:signal peptidase II [Gammaproteobacteria bacterium]
MHFSFFKTKTPINWLWLSVLVIVLDQVTKFLIIRRMELFDSIQLLPSLNLTLLHNYGAAFSFLADAGGWQRWFFITLGIVVSAAVVWWLRKLPKENHGFLAAGLALIVGGALGNVIDRALFGYVIDFIDVYYGTWHWPAFNVADSAITIGAVIMIIDSLFLEPRRKKAEK